MNDTLATNEVVHNLMTVRYEDDPLRPSHPFPVRSHNDVSRVALEIVRICEERGLTLSRWQANKGNFATTIAYAVHSGQRASQFRYQPQEDVVDFCRLTTPEGSTKRCRAWVGLSAILRTLEEEG